MIPPVSASASIPASILSAPVQWITDRITKIAEAVFGYLLRIVTFQLGEMKTSGAPVIMRIYQKFSSDPREERPFDPKRLAESKNLLIQFGGVEKVVSSVHSNQIHFMTFKSADFFAAFAARGSHPIDIVHEGRARRALLNPPLDIAAKFYALIIDIRMPDGTIQKGALLPESPPAGPRPHIMHSHSPGRSMCMDRRFIWTHAAAGYDVTIWDPPGTVESTGRASEGAYYQAADDVFQQLIQSGIPHNRIYVSGFCEGAAMAAYLKRKYHERGVHLIASNPYTSMKDVLERHGFLGSLGVRFGLKALQDPTIDIPQDNFDNLAKLRHLPRSEGACIFLHTNTDELMPYGTVHKLARAFSEAGPVHEILRAHPNPKENGHLQPPYEDPDVWRRYVQYVI
jgi:hypothetical protein